MCFFLQPLLHLFFATNNIRHTAAPNPGIEKGTIMKRSHTSLFIALILTTVVLLLCGFSAGGAKGKSLTKEEKAALKEVTDNTYTYYEVQAAISATTIPSQDRREYEVHDPLVVLIAPTDRTFEEEAQKRTWWYGGPNGYRGKILVHVYESHETHDATLGWYEIDCSTWIGEDTVLGNEIDLRGALAGLSVSPGWTQ